MAIINDDDNGNVITGTADPDEIYGNGGDDTITGGSGDTVSGGDGADVLFGQFIYGDAGNDSIFLTAGITSSVDGGTGIDALMIQSPTLSYFGQVTSIEELIFDSRSGNAVTLISEQFQADGFSPLLAVKARPGDHSLTVLDDHDLGLDLRGFTFENWEPSDSFAIIGGDGSATYLGSTRNERISGNGGDDTITGSGGDTAQGGDGDDILSAQFIEAGNGDDTLIARPNYALSGFDGGDGYDKLAMQSSYRFGTHLDISSASVSSIEELAFEVTSVATIQLNFAQFLAGGFSSSLLVKGGPGQNVLNVARGGSFSVDLSGLIFEGWGSGDSIKLNTYDFFTGQSIAGTSQSDEIRGCNGAVIASGAGDDVFIADSLNFGTVDGGTDWDRLSVADRADLTSVTLFNLEEISFTTNGQLRIESSSILSAFGGSAPVISGLDDHSVSVSLELVDENSFVVAILDSVSFGSDDVLRVVGSDEADTITGGIHAITVDGGGGNDVIGGSESADLLNGGIHRDIIRGGSGADTIVGDSEQDRMNGGAGADVFLFNSQSDSQNGFGLRDRIWHFKHEDTIDVSAIDANLYAGGDQSFVIDTGGGFAVGEIRIQTIGTDWLIRFNIIGSSRPELEIVLHNSQKPWLDDFIF